MQTNAFAGAARLATIDEYYLTRCGRVLKELDHFGKNLEDAFDFSSVPAARPRVGLLLLVWNDRVLDGLEIPLASVRRVESRSNHPTPDVYDLVSSAVPVDALNVGWNLALSAHLHFECRTERNYPHRVHAIPCGLETPQVSVSKPSYSCHPRDAQ